MNDIAQYMQETGVFSKDESELDEYEWYLYDKNRYEFGARMLSRAEFQEMNDAYNVALADLEIKEQYGRRVGWILTVREETQLEQMRDLVRDYERELGY